MHFKANVKGDTSNQPLKHYMQVFAPIYSHRSILVKICDRRSISLLLHPAHTCVVYKCVGWCQNHVDSILRCGSGFKV